MDEESMRFIDYAVKKEISKSGGSMKRIYLIACYVAFALFFLSIIFNSIVNFLEAPDRDDYDYDDEDKYDEAEDTYSDQVRVLGAFGGLFKNTGCCALSFGLVLGGITEKSLPKYVKLAMIIVGGLVIINTFSSNVSDLYYQLMLYSRYY